MLCHALSIVKLHDKIIMCGQKTLKPTEGLVSLCPKNAAILLWGRTKMSLDAMLEFFRKKATPTGQAQKEG